MGHKHACVLQLLMELHDVCCWSLLFSFYGHFLFPNSQKSKKLPFSLSMNILFTGCLGLQLSYLTHCMATCGLEPLPSCSSVWLKLKAEEKQLMLSHLAFALELNNSVSKSRNPSKFHVIYQRKVPLQILLQNILLIETFEFQAMIRIILCKLTLWNTKISLDSQNYQFYLDLQECASIKCVVTLSPFLVDYLFKFNTFHISKIQFV